MRQVSALFSALNSFDSNSATNQRMQSSSHVPLRFRRMLLAGGGLCVAYCLVVLLTVATASDLRVRWLLIGAAGRKALQEQIAATGVTIQQVPGIKVRGPAPVPGDLLVRIGDRRIQTSLDIPTKLLELSGRASPSPHVRTEEGQRWVEIEFRRSATGEVFTTWAALQPVPIDEVGLTVLWFLLQLVIFTVGAIAVWRRPFDRPARLFFVMCALALVAFVGGFHWWLVAGSGWLCAPFIVCALLLPVVTLHFFLIFPRPKAVFVTSPVRTAAALYSIPILAAVFFLVIQAALLHELATPFSEARGLRMLRWLDWVQIVIYVYLTIAALYFCATLAAIVHSVITSRSPLERQQVLWILWAALVATAFIGYTLVLAYWHRVTFALGGGRVPMFLASLVFNLAYAVGIVRYKLMLAETWVGRSVWYHAVRGGVGLAFTSATVVLAVYAGRYSAHLSVFQCGVIAVVLIVAMAFLLWGRDWWHRWVERRWFREKYRLDKALQRINRAVGQFSDPQFLSERTLLACRDALQAEWAALYLRDRSTAVFRLTAMEGTVSSLPLEWSPPDDWLNSLGQDGRSEAGAAVPRDRPAPWNEWNAELLQPIEIDGEAAGLVAVGPKPAGSAYTPEDASFLAALTQITGVALHCVRVHQDLTQLNEQLRMKVERIAQQKQQIVLLQAELAAARQSPPAAAEDAFRRDRIKGSSPALERILETVRKVAASDATVLLRGESGTGKELLARTIHDNSPRRNGPFVAVHCAALAPGVLESELFGHVRGAFTGATSDRRGRFELADGGTLFLDEIGDIPLETQVKLLRALQEREIDPVGGSLPVRVNVRVIAATHRPLEQLIVSGKFREDLYYRLNVVSLLLPPLRERKEDLHELAASFLKRASSKLGKPIQDIEDDALDALLRYDWPGNIRELENVIERAVVLAEGDLIRLSDLPADIQQRVHGASAGRNGERTARDRGELPSGVGLHGVVPRGRDQFDERGRLLAALQQAGGNKARAAKLLGLPRSTFFSKLKKHGLEQ
uniref:AAA family ATPase n=1 Tax=Schlesneria paludicola TaxID=360056 RepID=A0A7C4QNS2_9PLAN